ncbi:MAG: hypothetical protein MJZ21_04315, partial [archaeon]|nr:hypothetical protein [archaeon]
MPLTFKGKTSSAEKSSIENAYCESVSRKRLMLIICTISLFVTYIVSLGMGSVKIPVEESMKIFINMIAPDTYPDVSPIYTTIITKD